MRVFVAGHKGMVGSSILRTVPSGVEVLYASREELELTSEKEVTDYLLANEIDSVIMAAARVGGIAANNTHQYDFLSENMKLQLGVIGGSRNARIRNLVFLGSSCIYPGDAAQPISEDALLTGRLEPTNEGYALAKITGVRMCRAISDEQGFNYFSLMPSNLYGPNDNFDLFSSHVPAALMRKFHEAKLVENEIVTIWGDGSPHREFTHVDDLAAACWFFLGKNLGGEILNIGSGFEISIKEFALLIKQVTEFKGSVKFDSNMPNGIPRKLLNSSKALSMGWTPKISLKQGLESTYSWFRSAYAEGKIRGI
jgi:GDP-L-fucose synthase